MGAVTEAETMLLVLSFWFHKKRSAGKRFETRRGAGENTFSYKVFSPAPIPFTFLLKALFPLRVGKKTIFPRKFLQTAFKF